MWSPGRKTTGVQGRYRCLSTENMNAPVTIAGRVLRPSADDSLNEMFRLYGVKCKMSGSPLELPEKKRTTSCGRNKSIINADAARSDVCLTTSQLVLNKNEEAKVSSGGVYRHRTTVITDTNISEPRNSGQIDPARKSMPSLKHSVYLSTDFGFHSERKCSTAGMSLQKDVTFIGEDELLRDLTRTAEIHILACQTPSLRTRASRTEENVRNLKRAINPGENPPCISTRQPRSVEISSTKGLRGTVTPISQTHLRMGYADLNSAIKSHAKLVSVGEKMKPHPVYSKK